MNWAKCKSDDICIKHMNLKKLNRPKETIFEYVSFPITPYFYFDKKLKVVQENETYPDGIAPCV